MNSVSQIFSKENLHHIYNRILKENKIVVKGTLPSITEINEYLEMQDYPHNITNLYDSSIVDFMMMEYFKIQSKEAKYEEPLHLLSENGRFAVKFVILPEKTHYSSLLFKNQLVLHHTAGTGNGHSVYGWFVQRGDRVATNFVVDKDGTIWYGFNSLLFAHHLAVSSKGNNVNPKYKTSNANLVLDQKSISVELVNWGILNKKGEKYLTYVNRELDKKEVYEFETPFRNSKYYEKYTKAQFDALKRIYSYVKEKHKIELQPTWEKDIFDISEKALIGINGVYGHCSYRTDKTDIFPQPELIESIKTWR